MIIAFNVLDRFQENKALQIAQAIKNLLPLNKNGSFVEMKTMTIQIRSSDKYLSGFNHSDS